MVRVHIVVVDEADGLIHGTKTGEQVFEMSFTEFLNKLRPSLLIMTTATPLPPYIDLQNIKERFNSAGDVDIFLIDPRGDYNSITNGGIKPFMMNDEEIFLCHGELNENTRPIPYTNKKLLSFLQIWPWEEILVIGLHMPLCECRGLKCF